MKSAPSAGQVHDAVENLGSAGTPFAISEISEVVDCGDQTLRENLAELVADGALQTKEIGSEQVWWRPVEGPESPDTDDRSDGRLPTTDITDIFPDLADVMMIAIDQTGEITMANAKASEILGYPQDELVGANWFDHCVPDRLQDDVQGVFSQLIDGDIEPVERYENLVVTADGDERIIEWHNTILRDDGDIVGTLSSGLDITERKRAEEAVRDNERRLEALVEATTEGVYRISPDWSEIYELAGEGFLPDDLSNSWEEYIPDDEQARVGEAINEAIETQTPFEMEHKIKLDDGSVGWTYSGAVPIIEDGEIVEWFGTSTEITERKEREAELKRHEAYLESISDLVTVVDEDGIIQYETPTVTEMLGYEPDERVGDPGFEYIHPDDRERIRGKIEQTVSSSGVTEYYEYRAKTKDGEWIWVESTIRNLADDPKIDGIIVTARDITERKEQQREKDLLWQAVEKADSALVLAEPGETDNPLVYVNEAFEEMTGYSKPEAIGRDCRFLQGEHTRAEPANELRAGIENEEPVTVELRNYRKDGTEFWNKLTVDPVYDANGDLVRYLGTQEDITERKEQERKREEVIDRVTDAIFEVDADGQFTYVSERAEAILDESEANLLGKELFAVFDQAQGTEFEERYRTVMETREPTSFVSYYPPNDAWYDAQLYPNDDGGLSAYFRDVSDRKEREQAQERAEKQYQTLLELAPLPIVAVDSTTDEIIEANRAAGDLIGYQPDELVGRSRDAIRPDERDEAYEKSFKKAIKEEGTFRNLTDGSPYQIETKGGERVPVEISVRTVTLDGRDVAYGILRDITEERQYQRRLSTLNEITQKLSTAETEQTVKQTAADTLADILAVSTVAFYRFDDDDWELRPIVAANTTVADADDSSLPVIDPGGGVEWTALKNGETTVVDDFEHQETGETIDRAVRSEIAVPIDDHCVLVVGDRQPGAFDDWTVSLVETLGATTEAAITRTKQQQELQQQNQQLRDIEALNEQIREIAQTVVEADTRADLEQLVCEKLTNASQIDFAWIGRVDHQANRLSPQTQAGAGRGYLDDVSLSLEADSDAEPSVQAARSKAVCDCASTTENLLNTDWRSEAVERGFSSVLCIPLVHEESLYGVVSMYATTSDGFSTPLRSVLEELGDLLADAAVSKERKEALHADQTVTLSFDIRDQTCLFDQLVAGTDCRLQLDGLVPQSGDTTLVFVRVTDGTAEEVITRAEQLRCIETSRLIENNDDPLVELQINGSFIGTVLSNSEYVLANLQVSTEETTLTVEVPHAADTRQAMSLIESQFKTAQLRSKQQANGSGDTSTPLPGDILNTLTGRQREVVEIAYRAGYFDSPRRANGADVAELFGFSATAFHNHIREAQSKLFAELLSNAENSLSSVPSPDTTEK
jgi:PAS domain S-box-containing protein